MICSTGASIPRNAVDTVRENFAQEIAPLWEQEIKTRQGQERGRAEALAEEIRDLLLQAAYTELLKASSDGLFRTEDRAGFSLETVHRLRRHKFPFAGALKAVAVTGLKPSATDPRYLKLAQTRPDHLDRRFETFRDRIAELLPLYVAAAESEKPCPVPASSQEIQVALYWGVCP